MSSLGAMVKAECCPTGFAAKGKKVELVAEGILAMGANCLHVFFHGCVARRLGWRGRR